MIRNPELLFRLSTMITNFFLESGDFNGIPARNLPRLAGFPKNETRDALEALLDSGTVDLAFASETGNPHINRMGFVSEEKQRALLSTEAIDDICVYPKAVATEAVIGLTCEDRPYSKRLALVEAQLVPIFFELNVLERYFRDPRFACWFGDSSGNVTIGDEAYLSDTTLEKEKVSFKFGIGYAPNRVRVVAVFLYELAGLSPEHQVMFQAHEVKEPCVMNSDFERAMIWGLWGEYESVYSAFIHEQLEINRLCRLIRKPSLFKQTFEEERRPLGFSPMLRATRRDFQEFVHLLDKMLSDNIDRQFFRGDIPLEDEVERKDGRIEVQQLGTIVLLERWFRKRYRTSDGEDVSKAIVESLRAVRKARQPAAHAVQENVHDLTLPALQDKILGEAKKGLTLIRWALTSHPHAKGYQAPEWLDGDKIVFF